MLFHRVDVSQGRSDGDGMSTIVLILALLLTSLIAVGLLWWFKFRPRLPVAAIQPFVKPTYRTLTPEERVNIENYLLSQQDEKTGFKTLPTFDPNTLTNRDLTPTKLVLTPK